MSLVGPDGKQISEGPTGRKFSLVEVVRKDSAGNPHRTWAMDIAGDFELIETIQMLGKTIDFVATKQLTEAVSRKAVSEVQARMNEIPKETL